MKVLAMILAGGVSPGLSVLTARRSDAALPFAGKYRVIDFTLSNCVNSGLDNVAVLTQYMPRSLNVHIHSGKPWDLDRTEGGVRMLQPYQSSAESAGAWQEGSADAIRFNLDFVQDSGAERVLILAGNHVYKMNYQPLLEFHESRQADVTVAVRAVSPHEAHRFGMVTTDIDGRITRFEEKPRRTRSTLASMGIYLFKTGVLVDWLTGVGKHHRHLGGDVLPRIITRKRVFAYEFEGYWTNVSMVPTYYQANRALLADIPALDLSDSRWVIHTRSEQYPPVWLGPEAAVEGNLLCDGARIEGDVRGSVIGPGVVIGAGAVVRDSIIMNDSVIEPGAQIHRAIIDKEVLVGSEARVGAGEDNTPNPRMPDVLNTGITLVGKRAQVPAGAVLGRNVVVAPETRADAYPSPEIPSGTYVGA
ncbi:MAG: glucose-1-phosphate adenylyltransferase [Caldilineae bacterium]|nr:MAG: glucose-1-phosphate adenylyltransferase [Caldilineae bacterium]